MPALIIREQPGRVQALAACGAAQKTTLAAVSGGTRTKHFIRASGYGLRLRWLGTVNATGTTQENDYAAAVTIKVAVETSGGKILPVYFQGVRSGVIQPGCLLESDTVGEYFSAGDFIWIRTYQTAAATLYGSRYTDSVLGEGFSNVDIVDAGAYTAGSQVAHLPISATLEVSETPRAVAILGDSICAGTGDLSSGLGGVVASVGAFAPVQQLAISGESYTSFLANASSKRLGCLADAGCQYAITWFSNDIYGGLGVAAAQTAALALWAKLSGMGLRVIAGCITPRTNSTDFWKTAANQTVQTYDTERLQFNTWLRNLVGNGLWSVIDPTPLVEVNSKWIAPETAATSGAATAGTANTLTDSGKSWTVNQWRGYALRNITTGTINQIASNTATVLTLATNLAYTAGDSYEVLALYTRDGFHPAALAHTALGAAFKAEFFPRPS